MLIKAFPDHHLNDSEINKLLTGPGFRPHASSDGAPAPTAACSDRGTMLSSGASKHLITMKGLLNPTRNTQKVRDFSNMLQMWGRHVSEPTRETRCSAG